MKEGGNHFQIVLNKEYVALIEEYEEVRRELNDIIEHREHMAFHEAIYLKTQYMAKIGVYEMECFRYFIKYEKLKRQITLMQAAINREELIDEDAIEHQVNIECMEYQARIQQMEQDLEVAHFILGCPTLSMEESCELKKIYKQLAKKLHPDMNLKSTKKQKRLWTLVQDAYERGDVELLRSLERIASDISELEDPKDNAMSILKDKIAWARERIQQYIKQIDKMKKSYPFNQKRLLEDDSIVKKKKSEYLEQVKRYQDLIRELEEYRKELLLSPYFK